jgi:hypothetical protein
MIVLFDLKSNYVNEKFFRGWSLLYCLPLPSNYTIYYGVAVESSLEALIFRPFLVLLPYLHETFQA